MTDAELSPIKRALLEQRRLKARIEELERARTEPIAVIGLGCRFPGASGPSAFWQLLRNGVDAISDMPSSRWDVASYYDPDPEAPGKFATRFGGYLEGIDQFDAHAFGISPREAETMDPQQRLLLEVAWETLEHAGCAADRMAGSATGVFVGIGPNDYFQQHALHGKRSEIDAYLATGNAHSVASGRISYLLGLHGPSLSVDTACSSSLVAVHLACESLRSGSCDAALAGGVGILLSEQNYISLSKARMMALDGRCKTFDASADGFVRSEGSGMVLLKRLTDAQRDGDRILAVIRGSACNQDGRSNGITAPNGPAQQAVVRAALANARIAPLAVSYVEAHGTGTVLGDPIEVESLTAVLGAERDSARPLMLGSVKTNIGHTEAAAGIAGLIKTVLALQHREIPPSLHFRSPNPHIAWDAHPYLRVPTAVTPWSAATGPRTAGVSAFGFSGTNVHVVVEEAPETIAERVVGDRPLHVLGVSAKTDAALRVAVVDLGAHFEKSGDALADACYSVNTGRPSLSRRASFVASTADEMRARLDAFAAGETDQQAHAMPAATGSSPRVLFFFPGGASYNPSAAQTLYDTQPAFRAAVDECDILLREMRLRSTREMFASSDAQPSDARTLIFVVEYALAATWKAWGVTPDAVLGSGVGDYVAAAVAGVLRLDEALCLVTGHESVRAAAPSSPDIPVFSSVTGRRATPAEAIAIADWGGADSSAPKADAARAAAELEGFSAVVEMGSLDWDALTARLADVFVRGVAVDWRGFDRGYARSRVNVPTSPWMRQRYWFEEQSVRTPRVDDRGGTWMAATRAAERQAALVPMDVELSRFAELWIELAAVTTAAVARTIAELGLFAGANESHTTESAIGKSGILPGYRHLLSLWLKRLARAGVLSRNGSTYRSATNEPLVAPNAESFGIASAAYPIFRDYLRRCDQQMTAIVTGRRGPLETLFPGGSFETADFFYREWGLARYYNGILEAASEPLLRRVAGKPLQVLEIGAGTGGTASSLIPMLAGGGAEYWFTDVSEHFFARAETAFAAFPGVQCRRFDLDEDPRAQGIPVGQFDLVIAANSVHATRNLGRAIDHAKSLLAPGGLLMLYEVTTNFDWFEMSVALIEGWQHHMDDLRGETPLLQPAEWESALRARGFDHVAFYPPMGSPAGALGHHVIIASASSQSLVEPVRAAQQPAAPPRHLEPAVASAEPSSHALRHRLVALTYGERTAIVQQLVQRQVTRVMRLRADAPPPAPHDRLMSIGMDSLMAVELKKLLLKELDGAVDLPSTLIFDHPTIAAIATLILGSLGLSDDVVLSRVEPAALPAGHLAASAVAELSEEEVEALLAEQLKGLTE